MPVKKVYRKRRRTRRCVECGDQTRRSRCKVCAYKHNLREKERYREAAKMLHAALDKTADTTYTWGRNGGEQR